MGDCQGVGGEGPWGLGLAGGGAFPRLLEEALL